MTSRYPKIALQSTQGILFVRKQEILFAIANGNSTVVHLTENRKTKVPRKLKEVSQLLAGENFIRIHRSHLINLEHVVQFNGNDSVIMNNGVALPVARHRKAAFIEKFTQI